MNAPSSKLPPQLASRYSEVEVLGKGAYGRVFRARETASGELVAIKLLHRQVYQDPSMKRRFQREAELTTRIESPHVARIREYGVEQQRPFLVYQYVDGPNLADYLESQGGQLPLEEAGRIYLDILRAVAAAHAQDVLHRDLKPDNVLLSRDGHAVLTDFGLSREFHSHSLTSEGEMVGTLTHMTPEQLTGKRPDPTCDLYGATMIFVECVTGQDPFYSKNFLKLRANKLEGLRKGLVARGVPVSRNLDRLVQACLSGQPELRPQSAEVLLGEVERALGEPPASGGLDPARLVSAGIFLVGAGSLYAVLSRLGFL